MFSLTLPPSTQEEEGTNRWLALKVDYLVVLVPILFNLWTLRTERLSVWYPNDNGLHLQMTTFAGHLLSQHQFPLNHWYPWLSLGSPFFVDYQSVSAVITGAVGHVFGTRTIFSWSLYLLLALWPLCVYWFARLMEWSRRIAASAAILAPLLFSVTGHGFEYKSYLWIGNGLWSQMWAMWTLPLAWGFCWKYLQTRRHFVPAVLFVSLTIVFHFLTAYMVVVGLGVWVLVTPSLLQERVVRAGLVGVGSLLTTLWVTVPLLTQGQWLAVNQFQVGTTINDSYGGPQALKWLVRGELYDSGRLPLVTVLCVVGIVYCARNWRHDARARALVSMWLVAMVFFSGRPTFSFILNLLPGSGGILFQRYIAEVQLTGLLLAAVGAVALTTDLWSLIKQWQPSASRLFEGARSQRVAVGVAVAALVLGGLSPGWREVQAYAQRSAYWIGLQQKADASSGVAVSALVHLAEQRGGGRIYAGMPSNWGHTFYVGDVPVYIYLEQLGVDAVGFTLRTSGTMTDPEAYFNQYNPGNYTAFGIHYLLLPLGMVSPVPASHIASLGNYSLWSVPTSGLFHVVQTQGYIEATASTLGRATAQFLHSYSIEHGVYPVIAYGTQAPATPTLAFTAPALSAGSGRVLSERDNLAEGSAQATVLTKKRAVILLSVSYEPTWSVTVDGQSAPTQMLAPALLGVEVSPGLHTVRFTYHGYRHYGELYLIAGVTIIFIGVTSWRARRSQALSNLRVRKG